MIFLYLAVFTFAVFSASAKKDSIVNNKYNNNVLLFLMFVLISISIYNIEINSVVDMKRYYFHFESYRGVPFQYIEYRHELLFSLLQWIIVNTFGSFKLFLLIVWTIIFFNLTKAIRKMFGKTDVLFVFVLYSTFFIFFDYVLNAMRQGIAMSFLVLALSALIAGKKKHSFYIPIILAPLFHITSLPFSILLLLVRWFNPSLKAILIVWGASTPLFVMGLNSRIFSLLPIDKLNRYSSDQLMEQYGSVNRFDFLVFGVFFVFLGLFVLKYVFHRNNKNLETVLKVYILFNTVFICLGFIAYSDRIASYSWIIIPILLWYCVSNSVNHRIKSLVLIGFFLFISIFTGSLDKLIEPFI